MIPEAAIALIKEFEGLQLQAYLCPANTWTLGYGVTRINGRPVRKGDKLASEKDAAGLLALQLQSEYLPALEKIPNWGIMSDGQRAALISFAWNLGAYFYGSNGFGTITRELKEGNWAAVPKALRLYNKANGQTMAGLVRRREAEAKLWQDSYENLLEKEGKPMSNGKPLSALAPAEIRDLQTKLKALDYYDGMVDGVMGKNTANAWADFKTDHWLGDTDKVGPASLDLLADEAAKKPVVNWKDFNSKVSKYFTVGEVALMQGDRIPKDSKHQANVLRLAAELDKVREWWGSPLVVTSWYRPPHVEKAVGGSGYSHPFGLAADIKPAKGSVVDFQNRFKAEWFDRRLWPGGFGLGAKKGFIHLDLKNRRIWDY